MAIPILKAGAKQGNRRMVENSAEAVFSVVLIGQSICWAKWQQHGLGGGTS
jgi:fructose-specific component phosphotransferase system IIB-like protein